MDEQFLSSEKFVVGSVPTVFYIPEYVTAAEEDRLLNNHIYNAPVSKWKVLKNRRLQNWGGVVHDKGLLAQNLPPWLKVITHKIFEESRLFPTEINHVLINEYLPDQGIMPHQDGPAYVPVVAILSLGSPVIMNFTPHPGLNNATETVFNNNEELVPKSVSSAMHGSEASNKYHPFSVALMPRSLLIFKDEAYSDYLHGIKDSQKQRYDDAVNVKNALKEDGPLPPISSLKIACDDDVETGEHKYIHRTATRVSLTCRAVTKVHKNFVSIR